jgi:hypothetical protein
MSDQPFTLTATRSQLISAMLDVMSDVDLSNDGPGAGYAVDVLLHRLDRGQFPVHPDDAPAAVATGPSLFQPQYKGSPLYSRLGDPFMLRVQLAHNRVQVLGPAPYASGSVSNRPVVHTVAIIDDDLPDAIAAATAAVDHMAGR